VSELVDARGCLTPAGMAALRRAPVGQAPVELARHLASCARCQARLLAVGAGGDRRPGGRPARPEGAGAPGRLWRPMVFIVAALALALGALALMSLLRAR
jgi:hypothetical protein